MHSPFRHTTLPQTTTWLAAQGHDLTDDWSLPIAYFIDSWCPFCCSFGCVLLLNQMFWKQRTVQQYHSDFSDKSALEIRIRIWVRVKAHSHQARLRPSTSVARRASTDVDGRRVDARLRPSTDVDVRLRPSTRLIWPRLPLGMNSH